MERRCCSMTLPSDASDTTLPIASPSESEKPARQMPVFVKAGFVVPEDTTAVVPGPSQRDKPAGLPHEVWEARVTVIAALREEGYSYRQIARALGMGTSAVEWCARKARDEGKLRDGVAEAMKMLDNQAVPLAIDALLKKLRKGEDKAVFGTLEGRGLLKTFSQIKTEGDGSTNRMAFQFNFNGGPNQQTSDPVPTDLPGKVLGTPRSDEE